ncbi:mCpol domain-containing protein [Synechococcus elongatus IITB3]
MRSKSFFIAIDGDLVGRKIENLIISQELDSLARYSHLMNKMIENMCLIATDLGGKIYLKGGDSVLFEIKSYQTFIKDFVGMKTELDTTFSVGIGKNLIEAYLALKYAKSLGNGLIIISETINKKNQFKVFEKIKS